MGNAKNIITFTSIALFRKSCHPDLVGLRGFLRPVRGGPQQGLHLAGAGLDATVALPPDGQRDGRRGYGLNGEFEHHRTAGMEVT